MFNVMVNLKCILFYMSTPLETFESDASDQNSLEPPKSRARYSTIFKFLNIGAHITRMFGLSWERAAMVHWLSVGSFCSLFPLVCWKGFHAVLFFF